jgi:hypothetical protein
MVLRSETTNCKLDCAVLYTLSRLSTVYAVHCFTNVTSRIWGVNTYIHTHIPLLQPRGDDEALFIEEY